MEKPRKLIVEKPKKLTVLPYGSPLSTSESQARFLELLHFCHVDPERTLSSPQATSGAVRGRFLPEQDLVGCFLKFAKRLTVFQDQRLSGDQVNVVLTQTCPIKARILDARATICQAIPTLAYALWIIYADPGVDPSFESASNFFGSMDAQLHDVPVWTLNSSQYQFLVLTPSTVDFERVRLRAEILAAQAKRGPRRPASSVSLQMVRPVNSSPKPTGQGQP